MKIPREICEDLHGFTKADWEDIAKDDNADLTEDQKQSLYLFYTRQENREYISQKLLCDKNTVSRLNRHGMKKIISYYDRKNKLKLSALHVLPVFVIAFIIIPFMF